MRRWGVALRGDVVASEEMWWLSEEMCWLSGLMLWLSEEMCWLSQVRR